MSLEPIANVIGNIESNARPGRRTGVVMVTATLELTRSAAHSKGWLPSALILLSKHLMKSENLNALELAMPQIMRASRPLAILTRALRAQFTNYLQVFAGTG